MDAELKRYGIGWRHVITLLGFSAFFCIYTLRVNLSVALVAMVNQTAIQNQPNHNSNQTNGQCSSSLNQNSSVDDNQQGSGEFLWDSELQGLILGAFFYGYITTQIPGGLIASRYGGKWLLGLGTLCTALFTLVTPWAARKSPYALIAVRVLEGIGEGFTWPAMHSILSKWAPPMERTLLPALSYAGCHFGTVIAFITSGYLCDSSWGWPSVFYIYGIIGCVWFVFWALLASETHPWISDAERRYIVESRDRNQKNLKNGVVSSIPYMVMSIMQPTAGFVGDFVRRKFAMRTVTVRKIFNCSGHAIPGIILLTVGFVGCNKLLAVILFTLAAGASVISCSGFQVNHLDIGPKYAGLLFGITNTVATIPGFVSPYLTGVIINGNNTPSAWRIVFFITAGVYFFSVIFYAIFAEGSVQDWAIDKEEISDEKGTYDNQALEMEYYVKGDKF